MTQPSTADLLKYANLQMAAEAFHVKDGVSIGLFQALKDGNGHASAFTEAQAKHFMKHWEVVAQQENTRTRQWGQVLPFAAKGKT